MDPDLPLFDLIIEPILRDPVLIISLEGWVDAGLGASTALSTILESSPTELLATFDGDQLLDHSLGAFDRDGLNDGLDLRFHARLDLRPSVERELVGLDLGARAPKEQAQDRDGEQVVGVHQHVLRAGAGVRCAACSLIAQGRTTRLFSAAEK